jgi:hypothetical protein
VKSGQHLNPTLTWANLDELCAKVLFIFQSWEAPTCCSGHAIVIRGAITDCNDDEITEGCEVVLNEHTTHPGDIVFRHAFKMGLEGIVSKRLGSPYRSGRSKD